MRHPGKMRHQENGNQEACREKARSEKEEVALPQIFPQKREISAAVCQRRDFPFLFSFSDAPKARSPRRHAAVHRNKAHRRIVTGFFRLTFISFSIII
jgi:hypothetical protein